MPYNVEKKREAIRLRVQRFRAKQKWVNMDTKKCSKCGVVKPNTEFGNHWRSHDGLQSWCRECQSKQVKNHQPKADNTLKQENKEPIIIQQPGVITDMQLNVSSFCSLSHAR